MSVIAKAGASQEFTAKLQDFKKAFALTESGAFKTSVDKTKGELFVKNGKICSANIHGGKDTVRSGVTNHALRTALIYAFKDAGATDDFVLAVWNKLLPLGDEEHVSESALSRKEVKSLFNAFEQDKLRRQEAVGQKAAESLTDASKRLSLDDYRALARGSGFVSNAAVESEKDGFAVFDHAGSGDADYNAALRRGLYAAVKDADVPPAMQSGRNMLLEKLSRTLIAPRQLGKPLSCDEIRRTLIALDEGMGHVPPKALADRNVSALKKSGDKEELSGLCAIYEKEIRLIRSSINSGLLLPEQIVALDRFVDMRREMIQIGQQALGQKVVDVDHARVRLKTVFDDFCKANPMTLAQLGEMLANINSAERTKQRTVYHSLKPVLDIDVIKTASARLRPRAPTVAIESNSAGYIAKVLNNAAGGDCLFYSVADACEGLTKAGARPSDLRKANDLRAKLATHIQERLAELEREPDGKKRGVFCLHKDKNGIIHIPHSYGTLEVDRIPNEPGGDELADPTFKDEHKFIPTCQLAFLAEMLNRPIVLLTDRQTTVKMPDGTESHGTDSTMLCFNRNLETGEKLPGKPIAIHFSVTPGKADGSGGDFGHYQAVTLNRAGSDKLDQLMINDDVALMLEDNDVELQKAEGAFNNRLTAVARPPQPEAAEGIPKPPVAAQPQSRVKILSATEMNEAIARATKAGCTFTPRVLKELETKRTAAERAIVEMMKFTAEDMMIARRSDAPAEHPAWKAYLEAANAQRAFSDALREVTRNAADNAKLSADARAARDIAFGEMLQRSVWTERRLGNLVLTLDSAYRRDGGYGLSAPVAFTQIGSLVPDDRKIGQALAKYEEAIDGDYDRIVGGEGGDRISPSSRQLVRNVLLHGAKGAFLEGKVNAVLRDDGSVVDSLAKLAEQKDAAGNPRLTSAILTLALSLPPEQVRSFLRACVLLPLSDRHGLTGRLFTVADQLSRLSPEMLTPLNVIKLAWPELPLPRDYAALTKCEPADPASLESSLMAADAIVHAVMDPHGSVELARACVLLVGRGGSLTDAQAVHQDPKSFSLAMLPPRVYLVDIDGLGVTERELEAHFNADADRQRPRITIDAGGGEKTYAMRDAAAQAEDPQVKADEEMVRQEFFQELRNLCGEGNLVQHRNLLCFMTQRSEAPEGILHGVRGWPQAKGSRFVLKKDPATGDILATKTTNPDDDHGMQVTLRFGKDGSMSLVSAEEQPFRSGVGAAMETIRRTFAGLGYDEAWIDGKTATAAHNLNETLVRLFAGISDGTLKLPDALSQMENAIKKLLDGILPPERYKDVPVAGQGGGKAQARVSNMLNTTKVLLLRNFSDAMMRLSDQAQPEEVRTMGEVPRQADVGLEALRQDICTHVDRTLANLGGLSDDAFTSFCRKAGTRNRNLLVRRLFDACRQDPKTLKHLRTSPTDPVWLLGGELSMEEGFRVELKSAYELELGKDRENGAFLPPNVVGKYLVREIDPLLSSHSVTLEAENGTTVDIADPPDVQREKNDPRLDRQEQKFKNGLEAAHRLLKFFDENVKGLMSEEENAYNEILLFVTMAMGSATGLGSYLGKSFDFGFGAQFGPDAEEVLKNLHGFTAARESKISIKIGTDEKGKPQLVLTQKQPYGVVLHDPTDPETGKPISYGDPLLLHKADLTATMTIDLSQGRPNPGDPPKYGLDLKFEKIANA